MKVVTETAPRRDILSTYDEAKEIKEFDDTKAGVKGLVDSGVTKIPQFFIHAPEHLSIPEEIPPNGSSPQIPLIDFEGVYNNLERRKVIVEEVRRASETWGFFQMVNHGIPVNMLDEMLDGIKRFHEQPTEIKKDLYSQDAKKKAIFFCKGVPVEVRPVTWKDSLLCNLYQGDSFEHVPLVCREIMSEYMKKITKLKETLSELLSEALGLNPDFFRSIKCMHVQSLIGHYYPKCPEPDLTLGTLIHTDPFFLTILLQDGLGGLQLLYENQWVDVPPIHGALSANMGDLLQLVTNGKFKSVVHRVLAQEIGPRVSVATFAVPIPVEMSGKPYFCEPIKELLAENNPPVYKKTSVSEYLEVFRSEGQNGNSSLPKFSCEHKNTGI